VVFLLSVIGQPASLQKSGPGNLATCTACRWYCKIPKNFTGVCGVRLNYRGKLRLLVHSLTSGAGIDPIEKKPLFHFLPGTPIFSLGTYGCPFACDFCQNWQQSQSPKLIKQDTAHQSGSAFVNRLTRFISANSTPLPPKKIVDYCLQNHLPSIAFTYNEPAIFAEYAADTMKLAKKHQIRGVFVSDGYESPEALELLDPYIDAYNIDLKGATEDFYWKYCHVHLEPVLKTIKDIYHRSKWLEITTLLIPKLNTSEQHLSWIADFIKSLSPDIPWHISAFYPAYKMTDIPSTDYQTLQKACQIGKRAGLNYVYTGNTSPIPSALRHSGQGKTSPSNINTESTYCPQCHQLLISRQGFTATIEKDFDPQTGQCRNCHHTIPGIWV
jgi:pyruvate formate lyase activating enzyme